MAIAWTLSRLLGMGFVGVSRGTAIAYLLGCVAVLSVLSRGRAGLQIHARDFAPQGELLRRLLRVSVPAAADSLSIMAGQMWFLHIVNTLGDTAASPRHRPHLGSARLPVRQRVRHRGDDADRPKPRRPATGPGGPQWLDGVCAARLRRHDCRGRLYSPSPLSCSGSIAMTRAGGSGPRWRTAASAHLLRHASPGQHNGLHRRASRGPRNQNERPVHLGSIPGRADPLRLPADRPAIRARAWGLARDVGRPLRPRRFFCRGSPAATGGTLGSDEVTALGREPLSAPQLRRNLSTAPAALRHLPSRRARRDAAGLAQDHVDRLHADRAVSDVRRRAADRDQQVARTRRPSASGCDTESRRRDAAPGSRPRCQGRAVRPCNALDVVRIGVVRAEADRIVLAAVRRDVAWVMT